MLLLYHLYRFLVKIEKPRWLTRMFESRFRIGLLMQG